MSKLLFMGTADDKPYLHKLRPFVGTNQTRVLLGAKIGTLTELQMLAKDATGILFSDPSVLHKLTADPKASISDYAGSYFKHGNLECVAVPPLAHTITVPHGEFLLGRFTSKLVSPEKWMEQPAFTWEIADEGSVAGIYNRFADASLLAVDIETYKEGLVIRCAGYCAVWFQPDGTIKTHTVVIPFTSPYLYEYARKFNNLPAAKITQNGGYDHAYFFRYHIPCFNWLWDTALCQRAWYAELPRDLGFLSAFYTRTGRYWKDLATNAANLEEYYLYNARDCHATACVFLSWMREAPPWAFENYAKKFKMNFPAHMCNVRGMAASETTMREKQKEFETRIAEKNLSLAKMTRTPGINVNSHVQMKALLSILGCADLATSSKESNLQVAIGRHPLNARIFNTVLDIRGDRKLVSTYLVPEKLYRGRLLYNIVPDGTDTGRNASTESSFWCGFQIQNVPGDDKDPTLAVKSCVEPDPDFLFAEADYSQAETRGTAVITGDTNLLAAINSGKDFHSVNASAFFGVPYEQIYDDATGKKLNKNLRNLAKRVNHGANYNMGSWKLLETMGEEKVYEAKRLLNLNRFWSAEKVCSFLLERFDSTYPRVRGDYQTWVKYQVATHKKLVGATGWTRYCFGDPSKSKPFLNSYVAHSPQSLNAMILDQAFWHVFTEIALHPEHSKNFKLCAQIHDSILYQYRIGHDYLHDMVRQCMQFPVQVTDISGITRELIVPVDIKSGGKTWASCGD